MDLVRSSTDHVYINKEIGQDELEVASNTLNDAKRSFLRTETSILTYISTCTSRQYQPTVDNPFSAEKVRVQRLAAPKCKWLYKGISIV